MWTRAAIRNWTCEDGNHHEISESGAEVAWKTFWLRMSVVARSKGRLGEIGSKKSRWMILRACG
jgi:hypothetical protein